MKHFLTRASNGFWYILSKDGAKHIARVSTKTRNKREAEEILKTYTLGQTKSAVTIGVLPKILGDRLKGAKSQKTIKSYQHIIIDLMSLIGDVELSVLSQDIAVMWEQKHKHNMAETTYNTMLRSLRAILHRCAKWYPQYEEHCKTFDNLELLQVTQDEAAFMTREQFKVFLSAEDNTFYKCLFAFGFFTGMRKAEIRHIKWEHVDWQNNTICILNTDEFKTKNRKNRYIPISKSLKPILQEMYKIRDNGYIFTRRENKKLSDGNLSYAFHRTLLKTDLDRKLTFHSLRHSFASNLLMEGADSFTVSKMLGHSDTRLVDRLYGHLTDAHAQDVMNNFGPPQPPKIMPGRTEKSGKRSK